MLPCCQLQSLYIFLVQTCNCHKTVKSLLFKISYISHLCLWLLQWFQLPHSINKLIGLIFTLFSGSNTLCSVQPITLSFRCGIIGKR